MNSSDPIDPRIDPRTRRPKNFLGLPKLPARSAAWVTPLLVLPLVRKATAALVDMS